MSSAPLKRKITIAADPPTDRFKWLVELHLLSPAGTEAIAYHVIVTANSVENAFTKAEYEYAYTYSDVPPELNYFRFEYSDLAEIVPDYFWHAGEGGEAIEVRKLEKISDE